MNFLKFTFVGDPNDGYSGPDKIVISGHEFIKNGEPIEVIDEKLAAKLSRSSHFRAVIKEAVHGDNNAAGDARPDPPKRGRPRGRGIGKTGGRAASPSSD